MSEDCEVVVEASSNRYVARIDTESLTPTSELSEKLRWYFEDYPDTQGTAPDEVARSVEAEMRLLGGRFWKAIVGAAPDTAGRMPVRIQIRGGQTVPWELLRSSPGEGRVSVARIVGRVSPRVFDRPPRILWIICRPHGRRDLPFCTVADAVIERLPGAVGVDCLRPPSMKHLTDVLTRAVEQGQPYDIVHFDGHGGFDEGAGGWVQMATFGGADQERVDGRRLGDLLSSQGVSVLALNACRSAYWRGEGQEPTAGSFAEQAVSAGLPACLGMAYSVFPATARKFFRELYTLLAEGSHLDEAVNDASGAIFLEHGPEGGRLDCRALPVLFQRARVRFEGVREIEQDAPRSDAVGRDWLIAELEGVFLGSNVALLHGEPGVGKTTAALRFAKWFGRTGGCSECRVTSFQQKPALESLEAEAAQLDAAFGSQGLWIWDNTETAVRHWPGYLDQMARILASIRRCRVLITSRREESEWAALAENSRIEVSRLSEGESFALASSIASGLPIEAIRPLLEFAAGNPLVIHAVARIARRKDLRTLDDGIALARDLKQGVSGIATEQGQDSMSNLDAAFQWAISNEFAGNERFVVSALCLFGGAFPSAVFDWMVHPANEYVWRFASGHRMLLDRMDEFGFVRISGGVARTHPAARWRLRSVWEGESRTERERGESALVDAAAQYARWLVDGRAEGSVEPINGEFEEFLEGARSIAVRLRRFPALDLFARVLGPYYGMHGRVEDHRRVYRELVDEYVDPVTNTPRPGHESGFDLAMAFLAGDAHGSGDLRRARALYESHIASLRGRLAAAPQPRIALNLASVLKSYGFLLREGRDLAVFGVLQESFRLAALSDARRIQADIASDIAEGYRDVEADLGAALAWAEVSLSLRPEGPGSDRARTELLLADLELRRADAATEIEDRRDFGRRAAERLSGAGKNVPLSDIALAAQIEYAAGMACEALEEHESALRHYLRCRSLWLRWGSAQSAKGPLAAMARVFARQGRVEDARQYAIEALVESPATEAEHEWNHAVSAFVANIRQVESDTP